MTENDTEKKYPVHHTDNESQLFDGVGAVYVTKAEFAAMKSERDALRLLVDEKQKLLDTATDKIRAMDAERSELEHKLKLSEENADRLTEKLRSKIGEVEELKAENEKLKRALWLARANRALEKIAWFKLWNASISTMNPEDGARQEFDKWKKNLGKFLKKAEEYK